jgi:pSer/pThr/pTyr-binding forkhead associated (FHA) protein
MDRANHSRISCSAAIIRAMPLIRCPKCGQAYDVPGVVAVRLPNSIATCHCGEWLSGSKAAVLARLVDTDKVREIDLKPYRVDASEEPTAEVSVGEEPASRPRSVRVITRGAYDSINTVFTIHEHPLWIGRKACHVELDEAELSIRHCSISVRGEQLVVRDADSHMGTFLDGRAIDEAILGDGVHLLRVGSALVSVEPTEQIGLPVEPIPLDTATLTDESELAEKVRAQRAAQEASRPVLVCVEGPLIGQEFEIPKTGLVVGREGHVRVPDEFLSRRHFELTREDDGIVRVRDLGSRNGTFLNTLPARNTKVHTGDEISAGLNKFKVEQRA